uniref:SCP domain-containing protein n=1 Tax=Globodera pallida TaxID=36090 RepID=A0A183CCH0_GLOPA
MFSRGLLLFLLISNLPLIADGGWWWTTFNPIAEFGKRVVAVAKDVVNTVKEGVDQVVSEIGRGFSVDMLRTLTHSPVAEAAWGVIVFGGEKIAGTGIDWQCGPDDPKWLDKLSHIGTELLASMVTACRVRREAINQCCLGHDKCCNTKPRVDPCDKPFCTCLEKVGHDSGDIICLEVLGTFCSAMNKWGDKDVPHYEWLKSDTDSGSDGPKVLGSHFGYRIGENTGFRISDWGKHRISDIGLGKTPDFGYRIGENTGFGLGKTSDFGYRIGENTGFRISDWELSDEVISDETNSDETNSDQLIGHRWPFEIQSQN